MAKSKQKSSSKQQEKMPISKNEDVEFSSEQADKNDIKAVERAKKADRRQENKR